MRRPWPTTGCCAMKKNGRQKILDWTVAGLPWDQSALNFFINTALLLQCCYQICKFFHNFKEFTGFFRLYLNHTSNTRLYHAVRSLTTCEMFLFMPKLTEDDRLCTFVSQLTDKSDKQFLREQSHSEVNNQQQSTFQPPSPLLTYVDLLAITNKKFWEVFSCHYHFVFIQIDTCRTTYLTV
jgi:hypothetical protein